MAGTIQCGRREPHVTSAKIPSIVEIPNLIEIQKRSLREFLQKDVAGDARGDRARRRSSSRCSRSPTSTRTRMLEFARYHFGEPKYTVDECHERGMTFAAPLKVTLRLVVFDHDEEAKTQRSATQREQEVYLGELPLMTEKGTFIINGTERVVVSASCTARPACSSTTTRARRSPRASCCTRRASSPTAARGSSSSSTPTTSLRPHRPPAEDARDGLPARVRLPRAGAAEHFSDEEILASSTTPKRCSASRTATPG